MEEFRKKKEKLERTFLQGNFFTRKFLHFMPSPPFFSVGGGGRMFIFLISIFQKCLREIFFSYYLFK